MNKKDRLLYQKVIEELRKNVQYLNILDIGIARIEAKLDSIDKKLSSILKIRR
jgi:hypothetical protein